MISAPTPTSHCDRQVRLCPVSRQLILPEVGTEGQSALLNSSVSVVGCGATGSMILNLLARAGVGALTIIDRDFIELTNLQRQVFFDERDLEQPKTLVAADKVRRANSDVVIHDVVKDLNLFACTRSFRLIHTT